MTAVNNELIKAAVARSCDSIPPQQAQIVTVFVSGYSFDSEAERQLYRALLTCEDWQKSYSPPRHRDGLLREEGHPLGDQSGHRCYALSEGRERRPLRH